MPFADQAREEAARGAGATALWMMFLLYALARVLEIIPSAIPRTEIVALDVLSAMTFALVHGARHIGMRSTLVFGAICVVVGNGMENLGVATGFPFGRYYFAGLMGPKLFHVPVLLGLAYIGMAYVSWTLARLIAGRPDAPLAGLQVLTVPLMASLIMVAWDLAQDPVWATVLHGWVWLDGGPWFGVPVSNYVGWYLNVFLIYLLFALYLRRQRDSSVPAGRTGWQIAVLFYAACAIGNVLQTIPMPNPAIVADPTGRQWRVADITAASALVSVFAMGGFAVMAWVRMAGDGGQARD